MFFFHACLDYFSKISGLNLVGWSLKNRHLVCEGSQQPLSTDVEIQMMVRVTFSFCLVVLGQTFMTFGALETGLKLDGFDGYPGGGSAQGTYLCLLGGPLMSIEQYSRRAERQQSAENWG